MATEALICPASYDTVWTDVCSMTNVNTLYPVGNLQTAEPQQVAKATTTASTIYFIHGVARVPVGISIHNHNLVGATVTFAGTALTIPARSPDGQCTNVWADLRGVAVPSTTIHQLVITGCPTSVAIGRVCIPTTVAPVRYQVGSGEVVWDTDWPNASEPGYYGADLAYDKGVRLRSVRGRVKRLADQQLLYAVQEAGKGQNLPFLFVPGATVNDAWFSKPAASNLSWAQRTSGRKVMSTDFGIVEVSMGLPL